MRFVNSISFKIALTVMIASISIVGVAGFITYRQQSISLEASLDEQSRYSTSLLAENISIAFFSYDKQNIIHICEAVFSEESIVYVLVEEEGSFFYLLLYRDEKGEIHEAEEPPDAVGDLYYQEKIFYDNHELGRVTINVDSSVQEIQLKKLRGQILWQAVAQGIALFLLLFLLLRRFFVAPLLNITHISSEIAQGNYNNKMSWVRGDEMGILSKTILSMQANIKENITELNQQITVREAAEEELRDNEDFLNEIIEFSPVGIGVTDYDGNMIRLSRKFTQIFGYSLNDFKTIAEWAVLAYPDEEYRKSSFSQWDDDLKAAIEKGIAATPRDYRVLCKDGKVRDVQISAYPGKSVLVTSFVDITERKQAEEEIRRKEQSLRTTLDSIGDAVIATVNRGLISRMNPVAQRLTGWTIDNAYGKELHDIFNITNSQNNTILADPIDEIYNTSSLGRVSDQAKLLSREGEEFLIAYSASPIKNHSGKIEGVVLVFRDITEEVKLQEQLRQSQRLDAIGQLAGGVAHDFNNMLTGIMSAADLLSELLSENNQAMEFLSMITETAERAADLSSKLLSFGRRQQTVTTVVDIHEIIGNTVALLRNTLDKGIDIITRLKAEKSLVIGDKTQFQSVLLNLGINGAHAMEKMGRLEFATDVVQLDMEYCKASSFDLTPGNFIEIRVADNGHGIPLEDLSRIFEPFFTTKEVGRGTGLGLAASYGTVKQYSGSISVESQQGKGSCFIILLPLIH